MDTLDFFVYRVWAGSLPEDPSGSFFLLLLIFYPENPKRTPAQQRTSGGMAEQNFIVGKLGPLPGLRDL